MQTSSKPTAKPAEQKFAFQADSDSSSDSDSDSDDSDKPKADSKPEDDKSNDDNYKPASVDDESDWDPSDSEDADDEKEQDLSDSLDDRYKRRQKWLLTEVDRKKNEITKDKTEKKKRTQKESKKQEQDVQMEDMLTNEEAEKIVLNLYDVSKKDKIEPSKILTDLAKVEPIFDNLSVKHKIYYYILQVNKEFSLNSEQCLETGKFTVSFEVFEQIYKLIYNVVSLILITKD